MFEPHLDILPEAQRKLWNELAPTRALRFVLYGGTALALRLGHRQSVDFDFFSPLPLDARGDALRTALPFLEKAQIIQQAANTLSYMTPEGVKLSFFGNIDFGCIGPCEQTNDGVLSVASLDDLMATKLVALVQRVEAKDYLDVAALLDAGQSLEKGLCAVATLFGNSVPPIEIARTLTYFESGDLPTLPATIKNTLLAATRVLRFEAIQPLPVIARELDAAS